MLVFFLPPAGLGKIIRNSQNTVYRLSSTKELFELECKELRSIFPKLKYPNELVDSTILSFIKSKLSNVSSPSPVVPVEQPVRILLQFKDQKSADVLRKQLNNLSNKIGTPLQPSYTSRKLGDALGVKEQKPSLINQHSVVRLQIFMSSVRCTIHRPHNSTSFSEN